MTGEKRLRREFVSIPRLLCLPGLAGTNYEPCMAFIFPVRSQVVLVNKRCITRPKTDVWKKLHSSHSYNSHWEATCIQSYIHTYISTYNLSLFIAGLSYKSVKASATKSKVIVGNGGFTVAWLKLRVFQHWQKETAKTRVLILSLSFFLNTVNLNEVAPNYYYP